MSIEQTVILPRVPKNCYIRLRAHPTWVTIKRMTLQYAIAKWVDAFNRADVEALIAIYDVDAIHYPASGEPVVGRDAIRELLSIGTTAAPNFKCFVAGVRLKVDG